MSHKKRELRDDLSFLVTGERGHVSNVLQNACVAHTHSSSISQSVSVNARMNIATVKVSPPPTGQLLFCEIASTS